MRSAFSIAEPCDSIPCRSRFRVTAKLDLDNTCSVKHNFSMNKLPLDKRTQILAMLCEGSSMRSISRVCDVSINTVSKLLVDAGKACAAFHDDKVRGVKARRVQVDEIWSFTAAKQKNVAAMKKP